MVTFNCKSIIAYKCCKEANIDQIFYAFKIGFSDYIIKMEIDKEFFIKRFFGSEGNSLEYSFVAFDGDEPIGVILGGIKIYDGIKTLRCGALCIHPDYRGIGISDKLMELHKQTAIENQCKQLFLEVIVGNDRAIKFYEKKGYKKIYDISYFSNSETCNIQENLLPDISIIMNDVGILGELELYTKDIHINWQNDFDYIEKSEGYLYYGIYKREQFIGSLVIHQRGMISFLWVHPELRNKGIAKSTIAHAIKELGIKRINVSFPNNALLEGFFNRLDFARNKLSQNEMYLTL